jgi:hypothetical protein
MCVLLAGFSAGSVEKDFGLTSGSVISSINDVRDHSSTSQLSHILDLLHILRSVFMCVCVCVCVYIYIYTYIYIYIMCMYRAPRCFVDTYILYKYIYIVWTYTPA